MTHFDNYLLRVETPAAHHFKQRKRGLLQNHPCTHMNRIKYFYENVSTKITCITPNLFKPESVFEVLETIHVDINEVMRLFLLL